jgi:hypothetical protein
MAREYTIPAVNVTLGGGVTLVYFQAPSGAPIIAAEVLRAWASQSSSTTSSQQRIQMSTQVFAFPTLTAQAPIPIKASDPASKITGGTAGSAGTSGINASAEGAGAKTVVIPDVFNILNGYLWVPTPRETIIESAQSTAHGFGLFLPAAPGSLGGWNAGLTIAELG